MYKNYSGAFRVASLKICLLAVTSLSAFSQTSYEASFSEAATTEVSAPTVQTAAKSALRPRQTASDTAVEGIIPSAQTNAQTQTKHPSHDRVFAGLGSQTAPVTRASPHSTYASASTLRANRAATSPPAISLSNGPIAQLASVYAQFQGDLRRNSHSNFKSTDDIKSGLTTVGGTNAQQVAGSGLAFAAHLVSQDQNFRNSVLRQSQAKGRDAYLREISYQPYPMLHMFGVKPALAKAVRVLNSDIGKMRAAGDNMKESAYLLQTNSWARRKLANKKALILDLEQGFSTIRAPNMSSNAQLSTHLASAQSHMRNSHASGGQTPVENYRAATIAGLAAFLVLNADTPNNSRIIQELIGVDPRNKQCIEMAQLNLSQCASAMHNTFEIPFCIGEHAMIEVADCLR